jgi:ribulose-5-phosphate 4-epimerase/fuculose-1-phosphate aldolase
MDVAGADVRPSGEIADQEITEIDVARVALTCRVLGKLGLTHEPAGHVSMRIGDRIIIKGRGRGESGLAYSGPDDMLVVDLRGRQVMGRADLSVPLEVHIHTALYREYPDIGSVVHVHPEEAVLLSVCDLPLLPIFGAYDPLALRVAEDGIALYDRSILVSDEVIGSEFAAAMAGRPACVMRGHGITTTGSSPEEASLNAVKLAELAQMNYRARLVGTPRPLPHDEREHFAGGDPSRWPDHVRSAWRYYCAKVGEAASSEDVWAVTPLNVDRPPPDPDAHPS